ncbi:hypothetical protein [Nonomuraea turcica]|uniref:hypothetical protein n=1 Tax=Nonomuraea sp. G32 TaxID=3067274 RepID=UPI00273BE360|nr:hypothetical protein [Nonomuraea sp. G32]MDP4502984.1 hypothetical protein [Nonomuraea sp. G32]
MYRQGLVLLGLAGGMVMFGGSALAATPAVTVESVQANILPDLDGAGLDTNGNGERLSYIGDRNNFGTYNALVGLDLLNDLGGILPINILSR